MSELGYHAQIEGGVHGTEPPNDLYDDGTSTYDSNQVYDAPNPEGPVTRAALQEASAALERTFTTQPGYVPQCYQHQGGGNLPIIGWTVQNAGSIVANPAPVYDQPLNDYNSNDEYDKQDLYDHSPFRAFDPNVGTTPDWTSDVNPIGAGAYDQSMGVTAFPPNPLNRAPIGGAVLEYSAETDPNLVPEDQGGTIDLEW